MFDENNDTPPNTVRHRLLGARCLTRSGHRCAVVFKPLCCACWLPQQTPLLIQRPVVCVMETPLDCSRGVAVCPYRGIRSVSSRWYAFLLALIHAHLEAIMLLRDWLTTVRRSNVHDRVGRLSAGQLVETERAILIFLGLVG